jgi:zinc/manganese transport system permease protein
LLVGLVAAPAGAAHRLTGRPWIGLALSAAIAVGSMWIGLLLSYLFGSLPVSFSIMAVATGAFVVAILVRRPVRARP